MIDLAHCDDFTVGPVTVRPSSREFVTATGATMVEPKVMLILVALARADGRVVSRDDLVEQCWPGRIVGDDAINRVIGKLRRVADAIGPDAFRIETIARTGYRLCWEDAALPPALEPDPPALAAAMTATPPPRRLARLLWLIPVAAAAVVGIVRPWHVPGPVPGLLPTEPAAISDLETRGLSAMFENTPEQTREGIAYLRKAAALGPRSAGVWGSLAMAYTLDLGWLPPAERAAGAARVRDAAAHSLALDRRGTRPAAALVSLLPTFGQWRSKDAALTAAISRSLPDNGPLSYQRIQFLVATGRTRAALVEITRVAKVSPLLPWIRVMQIDLLAAAGRLEEADQTAAEAATIWPRDRLVWFTRFDLAAYSGQMDRALAMTADRAGWPKLTSETEIALATATAHALAARDPVTTSAVLARLQAVTPYGQSAAERTLRAATALGRPDIALAAARRLYQDRLPAEPRATVLPLIGLPADSDPPTAALFLPPAPALWSAPGFAELLVEIGLADYWRRTGPPDICLTRDAPPACAAMGLKR